MDAYLLASFGSATAIFAVYLLLKSFVGPTHRLLGVMSAIIFFVGLFLAGLGFKWFWSALNIGLIFDVAVYFLVLIAFATTSSCLRIVAAD